MIMSKEIQTHELFDLLDARLKTAPIRLAIEGGSAGGKTTLAALLGERYGATVFHMDDFFLRPHQRTAERLAEVGGNLDRERFLDEVLLPLKQNETVSYQRFDCKTQTLQAPISVVPARLTVIEGVYSMHPAFADLYDLSLFLDVDPDTQRERILRRNPPPLADRFFHEWIPMEHRYFEATDAKRRCDMIIKNEQVR